MMLVKISLYYCIFNKDPGWRPATLLMRDSGIGVFCEFWEFFKNTYFGNVCERLFFKNKIFASLFS